MNIKDIRIPSEYGAVVDAEKKRLFIPLASGGSVVAYFPLDGIQIYVYDVRAGDMPDLLSWGLRQPAKGRFLRNNICRKGICECTRGDLTALLKAGETAIDYGTEAKPIMLGASSFLGLESVIEAGDYIRDSRIFQKMIDTAKSGDLPDAESRRDFMVCFEFSTETRGQLDELLRYCFEDSDSTFIMLKAAEVGFLIGNDISKAKSSHRNFVSKSKQLVAKDIYETLTDRCGEKTTAQQFADKYNLSTTTVKNYFKKAYGYDFKSYQTKVRMEKAAELLRDTEKTSGEIAHSVGYASQSKFGVVFKEYHGMTPLEYRRTSKIVRMQAEAAKKVAEPK